MADESILDVATVVVQNYCDAIRDNDAEAFRAVWAGEAADTVISQSTLYKGPARVREFLGLLHQMYDSIELLNDGLDARLLTPDVAIVVFRYHTVCTRAGTGEPYGIAGLETQVLKRTSGGWRIAHIQYHGK
ncbi:MAG: nuclear transport factor 2 family protein [Atopobiaceae bacterium]|nr:nuclear transport factor 2 family protein [Atopobiaceae bacterium]MBR1830410.1 nuclear transport factor 2 family protein [Atopobiaceae bacterium]